MRNTLVAMVLLASVSSGAVSCSHELKETTNNPKQKNEFVIPEKPNHNELRTGEEPQPDIPDLEKMLLHLVVTDKFFTGDYMKKEKDFLPYTLLIGRYLANALSDMDVDDYMKHKDVIEKLSGYNESLTLDHQKTLQTVMGCHDYLAAKINHIGIYYGKKLNKNAAKAIIDFNNMNIKCLKALNENAETNIDYLNTVMDFLQIQPFSKESTIIRGAAMDYLAAWERIRDLSGDMQRVLCSNTAELKTYTGGK